MEYIVIVLPVIFLIVECTAEDYYYHPINVTRSTLSGIAAYRSSLTLDWLAAEDNRQRELAAAFETDSPPVRALSTECIAYARPSPGKIGRLMLELLRNLEGDEGILVTELIQVLVRSKMLVEISALEVEPDLEFLVKTPGLMMGEPHATFPRILAVIWMLVTDTSTTRKFGWCPINKVNQYLMSARPEEIAKQMRALEMVMARARFIMEEFIQAIMPTTMYQKKMPQTRKKTTKIPLSQQLEYQHPSSSSVTPGLSFEVMDQKPIIVTNISSKNQINRTFLVFFIIIFY